MSKPRLKTAKAGEGISGSLTIDSLKNQFKVAYEGEETFSLNSGNNYSYTKTITHNFGYRPQVLCYAYYSESNSGFTAMQKVSKFTTIPYSILIGTTPMTAAFIASIERSNTQAKFKFYEDIGWAYPGEDPQYYTLTDMKMRYFVFVEEE